MISLEKENYQINIAKKVFTLFVGRLLPTLVFVLISILYSRKLSFYDYGTFQSLWMYINISSVVFAFGLPTAILTINEGIINSLFKKNKKKVIGTWGIIFFSINAFLYANEQINLYVKLLCSILILLQAAISIKEAFIIKRGNEISIFSVNLCYAIVFFIWHYFLLINGYKISILLAGLIGLQLLKIVVLQFINAKSVYTEQEFSERTILRYIQHIGVNDTLNTFSKWLDKLILVYFITPQEFAIFFNGTYEIPLIGLIVSAGGSIFAVKMAENVNNNNTLASLFLNGFRLLSNVVFPIFFLFVFFSPDIFDVLFSKRYSDSISIFLISILVLPLRINSYTTILQAKYKSRTIIIGSVIDILLAAFLMIIFYQMWGLHGVALAIVISTYAQAIYYLFQSGKELSVPLATLVPYVHLLKKFFLFLILFILFSQLMVFEDRVLKVVLASIFTIVIILVSLFIHFKSRNVNYLVDQIKKRMTFNPNQ